MGMSSSKRANSPAEFERVYPHFKHFIEVAPRFWNYRTEFIVSKVVDVKTHMSVVELQAGTFVAIDAAELTPEARRELDVLTSNGEKLVASIHTHPFHTLAIPAFHAAYPVNAHRQYYGCPRHVKRITEDSNGSTIAWAGDLNECRVRRLFEPDLEMRLPTGSEFVNPQPAHTNHFSGVWVYHKASKTVVQDDTVVYIRKPGILLQMFGFPPFTMHFHPSLKGPGLYPTEEAPLDFFDWFQQMLYDWDFENLVSAHNGGCYGVAKETAQALLTAHEPMLKKLSQKNARRADGFLSDDDDEEASPDGWSDNLLNSECG
eukprot:m.414155 g.414155  ORF g.414155 m.414155 type:complete len:317 (-) comp29256_c0_seq1:157-1107(-)